MRSVNLLDAFQYIWSRGRRVALWAVAFGLAAYLISLLIPPIYLARAVILPPDEDELAAALSISRRSLGGLGALGRLGGGSYFTEADLALATHRSRSLHLAVVREFDLVRRYKKKRTDDAIAELRENSTIRISTDGTIGISVRDRDPQKAADMANAFLSNLDEFNRTFRSARARRTREFLEIRVADTDSLLRSSERKLGAYQGKKGAVVLMPDARGAGDAAASLMAQKVAAEVDLAILRSFASPRSEELQRVEARVRELSRQIGALPATQIGGAELVRQVVIQQQVLAVLTTQLEEARIREVMDTPTIQVLDAASPPEKRLWPRRGLIALFGVILGVLIGLFPVNRYQEALRRR